MNRKGLLLLLLLLIPLTAAFTGELALTTALSYNPSVISEWKYAPSLEGLYSEGAVNASIGARYQKKILGLSGRLTYDFGGGERIKYLTYGNILERSANPFFITLKGGFEYIPQNGWENILGLQAGKILSSTGEDFRIGMSLALGAYIHTSKAEGFKRVMVSFAPDATLSLFFTLFQDIYADVSFVTSVPYYFPKQVSYGWSFALDYDICAYFMAGVEGYLFFTDLIGETEAYGRRELSLLMTVRLPV